ARKPFEPVFPHFRDLRLVETQGSIKITNAGEHFRHGQKRERQFVARASGCDAAPGLSPNKLRSREITVSLQLNRSEKVAASWHPRCFPVLERRGRARLLGRGLMTRVAVSASQSRAAILLRPGARE